MSGLGNLRGINPDKIDATALSIGRQGFLHRVFEAFGEQFPAEMVCPTEDEAPFAPAGAFSEALWSGRFLHMCLRRSVYEWTFAKHASQYDWQAK